MVIAEESPYNLIEITSNNIFDLGYFGGDQRAGICSAVTLGSQITQCSLESKQIAPC